MSIAEKLTQIAANEPRVYEAGKLALLKASTYMQGTARGSALVLNDVSPVEHTMGVKVRGKNLFDISSSRGFESAYSGLTSTISGNVLTVVCTASARTGYLELGTFPAGTYTFSYKETYNMSQAIMTGSDIQNLTVLSSSFTTNTKTFTLSEERKVWVRNGGFTNGVSSYSFSNIQLEYGSSATDYTPYISDYTAVKEIQKNLVFNNYCEFPAGGTETYFQEIYVDKTFEPVGGKTYYLETSNSMAGLSDMKYTCTATANSIGGYTLECDAIRIETCSEDYDVWYNTFRITYLQAPQLDSVDFDLNIKEYVGEIIRAVSVIKTNSDGTVSEEYTPTADGTVNGVTSLYPCTKLSTDMEDIIIDCEYNRDINKAFEELQQAIISLGGNV